MKLKTGISYTQGWNGNKADKKQIEGGCMEKVVSSVVNFMLLEVFKSCLDDQQLCIQKCLLSPHSVRQCSDILKSIASEPKLKLEYILAKMQPYLLKFEYLFLFFKKEIIITPTYEAVEALSELILDELVHRSHVRVSHIHYVLNNYHYCFYIQESMYCKQRVLEQQ